MKPIYTIAFWISILLMVVAAYGLIAYGLKLGVDFRGGSVMELQFGGKTPTTQEVTSVVSSFPKVNNVSASPVGDKGIIVRLNEIDEQTHKNIVSTLNTKFTPVEELRFDSVGPTIGNELAHKSIVAIVTLIIAIAIYIAIMFRALARAVSPWAMSGATMFALLHDVLITVGFFAFLGRYAGVEISAVFVAAVLTILGYSISDTVIVFDRVRENVIRTGFKKPFGEVMHESIMQTLARSLNSSLTVLLSLIAIYIFGGESVKYFALALIVGIFLGAYSSIFVASPLLVWWRGNRIKKAA